MPPISNNYHCLPWSLNFSKNVYPPTQFTFPKNISNLYIELFTRSQSTREFASESKDHSLWFIGQIQFGTINLIKNHNEHRSRSYYYYVSGLQLLKMILIYSCLLHFVIRCPYLQNNSSSMDSSHKHTHTHAHILNFGNLKIVGWIIFSQNYEFSQLCVHPI